MDIRNDKDFTSLPEIAKLYQACKERDLTIAEREYLKGARDAWQAKAQAVPEGFVLVPINPSEDVIDKLASVICDEFDTTISGSAHCASEAYKTMIGETK